MIFEAHIHDTKSQIEIENQSTKIKGSICKICRVSSILKNARNEKSYLHSYAYEEHDCRLYWRIKKFNSGVRFPKS